MWSKSESGVIQLTYFWQILQCHTPAGLSRYLMVITSINSITYAEKTFQLQHIFLPRPRSWLNTGSLVACFCFVSFDWFLLKRNLWLAQSTCPDILYYWRKTVSDESDYSHCAMRKYLCKPDWLSALWDGDHHERIVFTESLLHLHPFSQISGHNHQSSGAVLQLRWMSWAPRRS